MIRRLHAADAAAWRVLRLESLRLEPDAFAASLEAEEDQPESWFAARLAGSAILGVLEDGELLGAAGYYVAGAKSAHVGHVFGVWVTPAARGRGHARALMQALVAEARTAGLAWLRLHVNAANPAAVALYRSLGFRIWATERDAMRVGGLSADDHLMERYICPG